MLKVKFYSFSGYGVLLKTSYLSFQWPINEKRPWNSQGVCFILAILTISIQTKQNFAILFLRLVCLGFVKHTYININMARTELRWFGNITILYLSCKLNCNGAGNPARMWVIKKYTLLVIRKEHVFCLPFFFPWFASFTYCPGLIVGAILPNTCCREFHEAFRKPVLTQLTNKPDMFVDNTKECALVLLTGIVGIFG